MRLPTLFALFSLFLFPQFSAAQPLPDTCVQANGLTWCYNPDACGQACNDVCAVFGTVPVADNTVWFEAQNTAGECQNISEAFGLGSSVSMASYTYACSEDTGGNHTAPGGLNSPLLCSTSTGCPSNHRTNMDQLGVACGPGSRRSVCPCEAPVGGPTPDAAPAEPVPTVSEWAIALIAMLLTIIGFTALRRRRS